MMRSVKIITASTLLAITFGCAPCRPTASTESDRVRIEIKERRVPIRDTIEFEIPHIAECRIVEHDTSTLSNSIARSTAIMQPNGTLLHSLESIPQKIAKPTVSFATLRDTTIYRERIVQQRVEVERELTQWQRSQIAGFWGLLLCLVVAFCFIFR